MMFRVVFEGYDDECVAFRGTFLECFDYFEKEDAELGYEEYMYIVNEYGNFVYDGIPRRHLPN